MLLADCCCSAPIITERYSIIIALPLLICKDRCCAHVHIHICVYVCMFVGLCVSVCMHVFRWCEVGFSIAFVNST